MVGPPGPDVVDDRIVRVVDEADGSAAHRLSPDVEERVLDQVRVVGRAVGRLSCPHREQDRRIGWAGVEDKARQPHPHVGHDRHRRVAASGTSVAKPRPITMVPGRLTTTGEARWYWPGVNMRS